MAGSSDDQCRRHADDRNNEVEEGEFVRGPRSYHSASDTEEYYNHYSSSESDDEVTSKTRWCFVETSNGEASCSSHVAANNNGYCASSRPTALACCVCGEEFASIKAGCGHMKVHDLEREKQGNAKEEEEEEEVKRTMAVAEGWGVTGKRGRSASESRSASPNSKPESPMAAVAAEPKLVLQPMSILACAATNLSSVRVASAETDLSGEGGTAQPINDDAMAIVVARTDPPTEAVVHHQAASPSPSPPPSPAGDQASPVHRQRAAPLAAGTQNPGGHTCGECGMWYSTHQALGGHVTAHKNRRLAAAGMRQDGSKPEKRHECRECSAVFDKGVQLGGHMRKHWKGDPIVPKKKKRLIEPLPPPPADLAVLRLGPPDDNAAHPLLALPSEAELPAPAVERVQPAPEPPSTGRVLLFGVDIGPGAKRPRTREGSPATKDSAGVGGQQQQ